MAATSTPRPQNGPRCQLSRPRLKHDHERYQRKKGRVPRDAAEAVPEVCRGEPVTPHVQDPREEPAGRRHLQSEERGARERERRQPQQNAASAIAPDHEHDNPRREKDRGLAGVDAGGEENGRAQEPARGRNARRVDEEHGADRERHR